MKEALGFDQDDPFLRMVALFDAEDAPPDRFTLPGLDGLITAITIGPELVPPSEWIALAWGETSPEFASQDEAQAIFGALMDFYNDIVRSLSEVPPTYEPIFDFDDDGESDIAAWCHGFMAGVALRAEQWEPLLHDEERAWLLPIIAHVPTLNEGKVDPADLDDFDPDLAIPALVERIRAFWLKRLPRRSCGVQLSNVEMRVKVGRNQPCPCGSGRKFKHCCLTS